MKGLPSSRRSDTFPAQNLLDQAQNGDRQARDQLLRDFTPFIFRVASQSAGRYLKPGMDEEISIALMAFNEAIDAYRATKGRFLSFAETVIKRRLIDYFRKRQREMTREVNLTDLTREEDEDEHIAALDEVAERVWAITEEQNFRQQEIVEYQGRLAHFGISWDALVRQAPHHRDARNRALGVARTIVNTPELQSFFLNRQELPIKLLTEQGGLHRKLIERNRTYIMAIVLILLGDFPYLQAYVLNQ